MTSCKNCDNPIDGTYCSACGQKDIDLERPFFQLIGEAIRETFDIDGRSARTVRTLLTRPGILTTQFLQGRRQEYTPPVRLYLIVSLLFFLLVAWIVRRGLVFEVDAETTGEVRVLTEFLPQLMIGFLPAFALMLKILHWRRFYFDHLIHALHLHTAAYIPLALLLPMEKAAETNLALLILQFAMLSYLLVYLFISLRVVYRASWLATATRTLVLLSAYSSLLAISLEFVSSTQS